jgi:threonyl-tRNA synthetase
VTIIPVGGKESEYFEKNLTYARSTKTILDNLLADLKIRIKVSLENRDLREAKAEHIGQKVPYIVVVGGNERTNDNLAVTSWENDSYTKEQRHMNTREFADELRRKIQERL